MAATSGVRRFVIRFSQWLLWLRARVAGFPIRLRRLALGLEDPGGFIDALGVDETV